MTSNYKRLGNYIQQVDVRNTNLSVKLLLGVSIEKKFIESHANTVGTDFSKYKIVKRGQFAYGPVTSRNGDKISIALLDEADACLISSSYIPFEIVKPEELNAEYLMMLFRNPEYDRFARYYSWGSAREVFSWEDFCDSELYIPDIEEQKKIVRQYKTITDRISVLEKLNEKLESLVELQFEEVFINFKKEDLRDTELGELPVNFVVKSIEEINPKIESGSRPKGGALTEGYPSLGADCVKGLGCYDKTKSKYVPVEYAKKMKRGIIKGYELLLYKDGGVPSHFIPDFTIYGEGYPFEEFAINEHVFAVDFGSPASNWFAYFLFKSDYVYGSLSAAGDKSAIPGISQKDLYPIIIIDPCCEMAKSFGKQYLPVLKSILINCKEILRLADLKEKLLTKLF